MWKLHRTDQDSVLGSLDAIRKRNKEKKNSVFLPASGIKMDGFSLNFFFFISDLL